MEAAYNRDPHVEFTGLSNGNWMLSVGVGNARLIISANEAQALRDELSLRLDSGLPGRAKRGKNEL